METWQMWYMHRTENPANEVQLLESPLRFTTMSITEQEDEVTYRLKLDNGQVVELTIWNEVYMDQVYYFLCLYINKRGKGYESLKQTGHSGLEGLLWAKEMLKDFIETIRKKKNITHKICVFWDDSRRRDVYARGLKDLGFKMGQLDSQKCLRYTIPRTE